MGIPKVSIIMNCLNGAEYLREAINSVFGQSYSNWEIVFWDNCSSDGSGAIAMGYDNRVRYFRSDRTASLGEARNCAFNQCCGKYVAILDVDDVWLPNKLEQQIPLLERNQDVGMVFSNSLFFGENGTQGNMFQSVIPKRGMIFGDLLAHNFISTETMIYRKRVLDRFQNAFNSDFTMVMDYDLSLRVALSHKLDYVHEPLSKWRSHAKSESSKKRFLVWKENEVMIEKLCIDYPIIKEKYSRELSRFCKFMNARLALGEWYEGNRLGARKYLLPYLNDPKYFMTYIASWLLPFSVFDRGQAFTNRLLRSIGR